MFSKLSSKDQIIVILIYIFIVVFTGSFMSIFFGNISAKMKPAVTAKVSAVSENLPKNDQIPSKKEPAPEKVVSDDKNENAEAAKSKDCNENFPKFDPSTPLFLTAGKNIKAGEYKLISKGDASYFKLTDGSSNEKLSILDDRIFKNCCYVRINDGQRLYLVDASIENISGKTPSQTGLLNDGMYKVGTDIPAGTYMLTPTSGIASFDISSSPKRNDIYSSQYFSNPIAVSVRNGDYLSLMMASLKY